MNTKLLTPEETAEKLRVSPKTIRDWLRENKIQGQKIGRQWRIKEDIVDKIIQKGLDIVSLDKESKDWLNSINDEDLPEYDWGNEGIPDIKPIKYVNGKWLILEKNK